MCWWWNNRVNEQQKEAERQYRGYQKMSKPIKYVSDETFKELCNVFICNPDCEQIDFSGYLIRRKEKSHNEKLFERAKEFTKPDRLIPYHPGSVCNMSTLIGELAEALKQSDLTGKNVQMCFTQNKTMCTVSGILESIKESK